MPRTVTSLSSQHEATAQTPVSLVRIEIPGNEKRIHDLDVSLYLNPTTNAVSMSSGAGLVEFVPYAGLSVPQIEISDDLPLGEVMITVANVEKPGGSEGEAGEWFTINATNDYRDATVTIWQGNLSHTAGQHPDLVTFVGAVKMWVGNLVHIAANAHTATLKCAPPDPFRMPFPWRTYSAPAFKHLPRPGKKLVFGFTEREL